MTDAVEKAYDQVRFGLTNRTDRTCGRFLWPPNVTGGDEKGAYVLEEEEDAPKQPKSSSRRHDNKTRDDDCTEV